ncbi:hypothetical protein ACFQ5J_04350 [Lacticaseibacillus baoqingensis]|uniref:Uncharacterized protein n=1 Tax=Lacticaseibacillus baoqingensis TaxID=2486013 RepID=A0ABW4E3G6_9LACO|nr:hypothetical protein [Lacticaseibacillus baoqingensis]
MFIVCALVTAISACVSLGFASQACWQAKNTAGSALINAQYAFSRSLALVIAVCGLLIFPARGYLVALALTMIGVQLFDGIIGQRASRFKTWGPC